MNSREVNKLQPYVMYLCERLIEECKNQGIKLQIISTLRDQEYQTYLYEQGRTRPGEIVTNSKEIGPHGYGLAFDVVPVVNGKAVWGDNSIWNKVGIIGKRLGFEWGGDWKFVDKPHFQFVGGLTTAELKTGKRPNFPSIPSSKANNTFGGQFLVYGAKLMGNGLSEEYAKVKAKQLKEQGYDVYYIKPDGTKINYK